VAMAVRIGSTRLIDNFTVGILRSPTQSKGGDHADRNAKGQDPQSHSHPGGTELRGEHHRGQRASGEGRYPRIPKSRDRGC